MTALPEGAGPDISMDYVSRPTNTFIIDWSSHQIAGMDSGLAAIRQAVDIILQNERFEWQIYSSNFGSELESLAGEDYDFIVSDLPRRIEEALSIDERILSVANFIFVNNGNSTMTCRFDVITVFGTFGEKVTI